MSDLTRSIIILSDGRAQTEREPDEQRSMSLDLIDDVLDDDVLREVFLYFPAQPHWKGQYGQEDSTWLSITHTCRRWRVLSLSTPTIWCNIIASPSFWTPLCLERSQSAPIDIKLGWSQFLIRWNPSDDLVASMLRHLNHTRTLMFEPVPATSYNRFASLLQEPADQLKEFVLQAQTTQGLQSIVVPDDVFAGRVSSLRWLRLEGLALRFKWTNPIFSSGLTRLNLSELSERACRTELLPALRSMTALEYLALQNVLHLVQSNITTVPGPPPPEELIALPKLERLQVTDHVFDVCDFIVHLVIPPFVNIGIEMIQRDEHEDAVPSVAAAAHAIATLAVLRSKRPGQRFACIHRQTTEFEVRMVTPADDSDMAEGKDHLFARFTWKSFNARIERATTFLAFLTALPLHIAHELTLYSRDELTGASAQDWVALGTLPATEIVRLHGFAGYPFVHVLSAPSSLPRLRKITAHNVHFASPTRSGGLGSALVRRLTGAPLEVLEMKNCKVAVEQVDMFRGFCGEVKNEGTANTWGAVGTSAAAMASGDEDD
ncbi:hypothetical protein PENSPDRAFT_647751 [Peniophora sp. CONT]|nr:hypothetical protein PENSPDRAFT_647751 [Peniophora sp. CONT]